MRRRRRPINSVTINQLINILSQQQNRSYVSTLKNPSSSFFHHHIKLVADGESVGAVFSNFDEIEKYRHKLFLVTIAGIDGTFKTVPSCPPQLNKGCLLTFKFNFSFVLSRYVITIFLTLSFPLVYALTSKTNQLVTYVALIRIFQQILNNWL